MPVVPVYYFDLQIMSYHQAPLLTVFDFLATELMPEERTELYADPAVCLSILRVALTPLE